MSLRGDALVNTQLLMARAVSRMAEHIDASTGYQLTPVHFADLPPGKTGMIACVDDSVSDTPGRVIVGGGTNVVLAFYDGSNWIVGAGDVTGLPRGAFRVRNATNQTVPNATFTKVDLTVMDTDLEGWWNGSLSRYIPQVPGFYFFAGTCGGSGANASGVSIVRNGLGIGTNGADSIFAYAGGKLGSVVSVSVGLYLNGTTDYVELYGAIDETPTAIITAATFSGSRLR